MLEYSFNTIPIGAVVDVLSRGLQVYQLLDSLYNCNCQLKSPLRSSPWYGSWVVFGQRKSEVPKAFHDVVFCSTSCVKNGNKLKKKNKTIVNSTHSWYFHFFICKKKKPVTVERSGGRRKRGIGKMYIYGNNYFCVSVPCILLWYRFVLFYLDISKFMT